MASLEVSPLNHRFDEDQISALKDQLGEYSEEDFDTPEDAGSHLLDANIDDDVLADFIDQLDANDAASDVYLPVDFDDSFEVGGNQIGSAHQLLLALENIKESFDLEDEDDDDGGGDEEEFEEDEDETGAFRGDEDAAGIELKDEQLSHLWRLFYRGANTAIRTGLCLFVTRE